MFHVKQNVQYRVWWTNDNGTTDFFVTGSRVQADRECDHLQDQGKRSWVQVVQN